MYMCMYTYMYMYTRRLLYTYVYTRIHAYMYIFVYICRHALCTCIYFDVSAYINMQGANASRPHPRGEGQPGPRSHGFSVLGI